MLVYTLLQSEAENQGGHHAADDRNHVCISTGRDRRMPGRNQHVRQITQQGHDWNNAETVQKPDEGEYLAP